MRGVRGTIISTLFVAVLAAQAQDGPTVSFSGFLDADVWTDFEGNFFNNHELDIGMALGFSENVAANVYVTMTNGSVPAGGGMAAGRWGDVAFDGFDLTFSGDFGELSVGDLVYQFGGFGYYAYKRLSMITTESFTRGIQYSLPLGGLSQTLLVGASDANTTTANFIGSSAFEAAEGQALALYYGAVMDMMQDFDAAGEFFAGAEYNGAFGEMFATKVAAGFRSFGGESNVYTLLVEPVLSMGNISVAGSFYTLVDPDSVNESIALANALLPEDEQMDPLYGIGDELYVYVEPGITLSEQTAFGLPLEYHAADIEVDTDDTFWVVPTFYVYPFDNTEWWLWGAAFAPMGENPDDLTYGLGSEIIVTF
jgi:hypothetical protein